MIEEFMRNPNFPVAAIMARIRRELPGMPVDMDYFQSNRNFLYEMSQIPVWLHTYMQMNGRVFDERESQELALAVASTMTSIPKPEHLAKIIHIWGRYCVIPLRQGDASACIYTQVPYGETIRPMWVMGNAAIQRYLSDSLVALRATL